MKLFRDRFESVGFFLTVLLVVGVSLLPSPDPGIDLPGPYVLERDNSGVLEYFEWQDIGKGLVPTYRQHWINDPRDAWPFADLSDAKKQSLELGGHARRLKDLLR